MKRFVLAVCLALMTLSPVLAQTSDDEENPQETTDLSPNKDFFKTREGDQYFRISLDLTLPLNFPNITTLFNDSKKLAAGGSGFLGYHIFLTDTIAVGADIGFGFNATIGEHMFHYVPVMAAVTWQPSFKRFEFPLTLSAGFAWETYNGYSYFPGLVVKPSAGLLFRPLESWSFGAELSYLVMPQFAKLHGTGDSNIVGQWLEVDISARYYF